jgi:hypothetical protein
MVGHRAEELLEWVAGAPAMKASAPYWRSSLLTIAIYIAIRATTGEVEGVSWQSDLAIK